MKRNILVFVVFAFFGSLYAVEDTSQLQADETQKTYERKAVMGFEDIGFTQDEATVAMSFCGSDGKCQPWGVTPVVKIGIDNSVKSDAAKIFYQWTITNRMDKIILGDNKAYIMTKTGEASLDLTGDSGRTIPPFVSGTMEFDAFQKHVEEYLNSDVKEIFGDLLDSGMEARYKELSEQEQETFITTKAKELGISAEFAEKLLNSAYVFAGHVASVNGVGQISQSEAKASNSKIKIKVSAYSVTITLNVKVDFLIYHYNYETKQFELYGKIKGVSGPVPESSGFDIVPTPDMVVDAFRAALRTAVKAASISANYELKKDDNFALFIPVKNVANGTEIETNFGVMEDIRMDHPFSILETVDGKVVNKGWAKARKIGKNCTDDCGETTLIKITNGKVEEGDQLREHPWTGVFANGGIGLNGTKITGKNKNNRGYNNGSMAAAPGFHAGLTFDLGYMLDAGWASEFYGNVFLDFDYSVNDGRYLKNKSSKGLAWFGGGFGVAKRFYGKSGGFFFAPALDIAFRGGWGKGDNKYEMTTFITKPHMQVGWSFNPNLDFLIKVGWNLGALVAAKESKVKILKEYNKFAHGLYLTFDFDFHLPIVGVTAKLFKAPSDECKKDKKQEENSEKTAESEESKESEESTKSENDQE